MGRRAKSLHHNLQEGQNVVYHREHRSKKGRMSMKKWAQMKRMAGYKAERKDRIIERRVKTRLRKFVKNNDFGDKITA
jgi:hypothetical protein